MTKFRYTCRNRKTCKHRLLWTLEEREAIMGNLMTSARARLHRHGEDPTDSADNPYRYPPREGELGLALFEAVVHGVKLEYI